MTRSWICPRCSVKHSPMCEERMWPIEPLLDRFVPEYGVTELGKRLGCGHHRFVELADAGLTDVMADRWATRLGLHPEAIWPGWCDAGLTVADRWFMESGWRQVFEWTEANRPADEAAA